MSKLQVRHIATLLKQTYLGKIDVSDCISPKSEDQEVLF